LAFGLWRLAIGSGQWAESSKQATVPVAVAIAGSVKQSNIQRAVSSSEKFNVTKCEIAE
jgi:hypothetical protein